MSKEFLQVEDNPSLVRDNLSQAIINIDNEAYERYMEKKKHQLSKDQEIVNLRKEIEDLKNMIYKMVEGGALNQK